ncbi:hypothetical protein HMPREF1544_08424 [Mucor circinelloides 1006PhL]|uniref:Uncharacterized protein n=1 Tax=Mucor circinelloides f. circinelloides (strain 1006PhL) TaxID=1220926 RepID=S2J3R6_MUCC1|nr:hypothetical protein HMPREF1544_08424 [Mucor circinelloides 1006PhL]KAG1115149.1 hypothetical protein G6F42_014008 [Rhizopus arrhizus]
MYKKRQRFYRDLTLNPDDELSELNEEDETEQKQNEEAINDTGSVGSSATHESIEAADEHNSVDASATTPTPTTVQKQEEPAYRPRSKSARMKSDKPVEIGYRNMQKLIPKGSEWQLMQDPVRMQMRQVLSDAYRKTLSNIPGSTTSGQLSKQTQEWGHGLLVPIASEIDKDLRLTLIPAKIDAKLLDFDIPVAYRKLNQQVEDNCRKVAEFSAKVDEREAGLIPLREELVELEKRYKTAKDQYDTRMRSNNNSRDYVQMLFLHPSSEQY